MREIIKNYIFIIAVMGIFLSLSFILADLSITGNIIKNILFDQEFENNTYLEKSTDGRLLNDNTSISIADNLTRKEGFIDIAINLSDKKSLKNSTLKNSEYLGYNGWSNSKSGGTTSENPSQNNKNKSEEADQNITQNASENILYKKIKKLPKELKLKHNNLYIQGNENFSGNQHFMLTNRDLIIAEFDINFSSDIDLSDLVADIDNSAGKTFMHSSSGILKNISLYLIRNASQNMIIICSNASSFEQIHLGCVNESSITSEEMINVSSPRVRLSADQSYYIIDGITGTGVTGANVTVLNTSRGQPTLPGNVTAIAGYLTPLFIPTGWGLTGSWQGYFGEVTAIIQLADSSDLVMYNWTSLNPLGQVYITTNSSVYWQNIQCFNFSATGTYENDVAQAGNTSLFGTNLSQLETAFGILDTDMDGVDETFNLIGPDTHEQFYSSYHLFEEGECPNTRIFSDSGPEDGKFEEVIMYEPVSKSVIFGSLINQDILGFDNRTHDFEALVLENGHNGDILTTTYYFFMEIS